MDAFYVDKHQCFSSSHFTWFSGYCSRGSYCGGDNNFMSQVFGAINPAREMSQQNKMKSLKI